MRKAQGVKYASMTEIDEKDFKGGVPHSQIPEYLNEWNGNQKFRHSIVDFIQEDCEADHGDQNKKEGNNMLKVVYQSSSECTESEMSKPVSKVQSLKGSIVEEENNKQETAPGASDIEMGKRS